VATSTGRAVVLVSGGDANTPFTTPESACRAGMPAGITNSHLRQYLLERGLRVFTAPASNRRGPVVPPGVDSADCFDDCPETLGAHLTITSSADIDLAGERLARFIEYLREHNDVDCIDLVGHSNGGLFSRSAIRVLQQTGSKVGVASLATIGTPWHGSFGLRYLAGEIDISACAGDPWCEKMLAAVVRGVARDDFGLAAQNTVGYLDGPTGWNAAQAGVLDEIPVLLVGGGRFTHPKGDPELWPFDGYVSVHSALARHAPPSVLPAAETLIRPDTHSIFLSRVLKLDDTTGLTGDPEVLERVGDFISAAPPR
jgi:pimeloyl-ACP methyl ester carboxylesterase